MSRIAVASFCLSLTLANGNAAEDFRVLSLERNGTLTWTNAPVPGVCTLETANVLGGLWTPAASAFATQSAGILTLPVAGGSRFHRLRAVDFSPTPRGFTNLVEAYGILETIAGTGEGQTDGVSYWQSWFEGQPGAWVSLSRPHFAMADRAGNVYIADKNSHAILRLAPEGAIYTCAGTHLGGFNGEGPAAATELQLNLPNGDILVCDRGAHYVYRVTPTGSRTVIAGNGTTTGGGDGASALATGLNGVRAIWPVPTGGYLLLTHDGCQLWYLDAAGIVYRLLNGAGGRTHDGDGLHFYSPEPKISEGRSVALDHAGNVLICESDYGYVRRIRFQRLVR